MSAATQLLSLLPIAIYMTDADGRITYFNDAAAELWGQRPHLGTVQWCGSWRLYWPDGQPMRHEECPMAVTLKEGKPVRGQEAIAERPDGTRVRFLPYPTPLRDDSGRLIGAINLLMDTSHRYDAEIESARLAAIVASSNDAIVSKTLDGTVTSWNAAATGIFGYEAGEMIGQSITRIIPPELRDEERHILARLQRGERIEHYDTVRITKDGRRIDISLTVSPVRDRIGRIVGASKVARDVTDRKRAEKLQALLTDELNHRVKNSLATVQAIANQSLRHTTSPAEFVSSFMGRVQALASAHDLLTQTKMQGAELRKLIKEQVLLDQEQDERVSFSGPHLLLGPHSTVHLGMVLHELATNARKYGALSVPRGRLSVKWELRTNGGRSLHLVWQERNGPKVNAPSSRGFGSTLIEQTPAMHGGQASIHYGADGVTCKIRLPLVEEPQLGVEPGYVMAPRSPAGEFTEQEADRGRLLGKRVLIVEDEPLVSMDIAASLSIAGCEIVGPAGSFEKAKLLIDEERLDAALVDLNLTGHTADELAAALTQKQVPFAFVTGYGRDALPRAFRDALMLGKPHSQDQLLALLQQLIDPRPGVVPLRQSSA
jgi:PAS domain S-box-containing protein